jgi:hypothetical protein
MPCGIEVVFAADLFFQLAYFGREEFDRYSAVGAYHVMMAPAIELVFVTGDTVMESHFTGQAAFRQQLERSVHGGKTDLRVLLPSQAEEFIRGEMIAGLKKGAQDRVALIGMFEADTLQVAVKNVLSFPHRFASGGSMIVNPPLQY